MKKTASAKKCRGPAKPAAKTDASAAHDWNMIMALDGLNHGRVDWNTIPAPVRDAVRFWKRYDNACRAGAGACIRVAEVGGGFGTRPMGAEIMSGDDFKTAMRPFYMMAGCDPEGDRGVKPGLLTWADDDIFEPWRIQFIKAEDRITDAENMLAQEWRVLIKTAKVLSDGMRDDCNAAFEVMLNALKSRVRAVDDDAGRFVRALEIFENKVAYLFIANGRPRKAIMSSLSASGDAVASPGPTATPAVPVVAEVVTPAKKMRGRPKGKGLSRLQLRHAKAAIDIIKCAGDENLTLAAAAETCAERHEGNDDYADYRYFTNRDTMRKWAQRFMPDGYTFEVCVEEYCKNPRLFDAGPLMLTN